MRKAGRMDPRSEKLVGALDKRFAYTKDNNRDVITDPMFGMAEAVEEIEARRCSEYLQAYLTRCDPATDTACWD